MAAPNRRVPRKRAASDSPANRKLKPRSRALKAATRTATYAGPREREPLTIPLTWVKAGVAVVLLPVAAVTAMAFFDALSEGVREGMWKEGGFWFFGLGLALWLMAYATTPHPLWLYVLGHELTHAVFILACGGRVERFSVSRRGGFVITDRTNVLITLSPYFVPFYTVLVLLAFGVLSLFVDITQLHKGVIYGIADFKWEWMMFALIGLTWGFHLTFTVSMVARDQPDLRENGVLFSMVFIFLTNLVVITLGLVAACPQTNFARFGEHWLANAVELCAWSGHVIRTLF